jgi:hypothetical protein
MKKFNLLFLLLTVVAVVACKDDETPTPTFQKSQFIGQWEVTNYQAADPDQDAPCEYNITETEFEQVSGCDGSFSITLGGEYTFDGKNKITLKEDFGGFEISWVIVEIKGNTMKIQDKVDGETYGTATVTKK